MTVLMKCLYPKILYIMQYVHWGLEGYKQVEDEISRIIVEITNNMKGYPRGLLYANEGQGGMEIKSIVECSQRRKLGELTKGLMKGGDVGVAFRSLMNRVARSGGTPFLKGRMSTAGEPLGERYGSRA